MAAFRLAGATDRAVRGDEQESAFRRLALAATKYWVCKRAPAHAGEALECLGGNGYVEDSGIPACTGRPRWQSIWEGSGNVAALDALRALTRQPESAEAFFAELDQAAGADRRLDQAVGGCAKNSATRRRPGLAIWLKPWPSPFRDLCSSGTATPPWPTRSSRPA